MAKIKINDFARRAYKRYIEAGMTPAGACGLLGNQYAESAGFLSNRVEFLCIQRLKESGRSYTDETYTRDVDSGKINRAEFLNPLPGKRYGYGLCQWTSTGRKGALYDLAKKRGVSIADETMQIDFTLIELGKDYQNVLKVLMATNSVKEASDYVLVHFESPADCGNAVKNIRYDYAQQYYDAFAGNTVVAEDVLRVMRTWIGMSRIDQTHRPIVDLYNSHKPLARGYKVTYQDAYCDVTVSAAFIKVGAINLIGGTECGVEEHVNLFKAKGIWQENGTVVPEPGDIIVFNWDQAVQPNNGYSDHIGIVETVDKQKKMITTIEGNMDGGIVGRRTIPVGWGNIRGYAQPKYADAATKPEEPAVPDKEPEKPSEKPENPLSYKIIGIGTVTADVLNVRTWAGTKYPLCSFNLKNGEKISVCDTVKAENGTDWYFFKHSSGKYGFCSSEYVKYKAMQEEGKLNTAVKFTGVVTTGLYVRVYGGTEYAQCSFSPLKTGEEVGVCDTVKAKNGDDWFYIKNKDGKYGFASAKYIRKKGESESNPVDKKIQEILNVLSKYQKQIAADKKAGKKWRYYNSKCSSKFSTAVKKENRRCNCALLIRWMLRELGLLNADNWWGEKDGTIIWRGNSKQQMLKHFDLIHIGGKKTVNQAIKDGTLQAGDIVTYVKMQHTNVYAGNGKWYDAGHAYASGSGEGAVFKSWYGDTVHGAQPIGYILRRKGSGQPDQKLHIVREGMYIKKANADRQCKAIRRAGIDCIVKLVNGKYWTQCGAFEELENAEVRVRQLRARGFDGMIK